LMLRACSKILFDIATDKLLSKAVYGPDQQRRQ